MSNCEFEWRDGAWHLISGSGCSSPTVDLDPKTEGAIATVNQSGELVGPIVYPRKELDGNGSEQSGE